MQANEQEQTALIRAVTNVSMANYAVIFEGLMEKGIPADDIIPRENVFTFPAWKALGRIVKKGERGVKIVTFVSNEKIGKTFPKTTTVFHISQTEELK